VEQKQEQAFGFARWSWFAVIEKLSQGDITRFDQVTEQNFISCLNLLSYWKEKDEMEEKIRKQIKQNKIY